MNYPGLTHNAEDILACYQHQGMFILLLATDAPYPFHAADAAAFCRWLDAHGIGTMPQALAERIAEKALKQKV